MLGQWRLFLFVFIKPVIGGRVIRRFLLWKRKQNAVVLLWRPEVEVFCAESLGTLLEPEDWVFMSPFKNCKDGFIVRVCTEQTGLLYRCRAAETGLLILTACAVHLSLLVPPLHSSSFPLSAPKIKWLFVLRQWCLSLVSPLLPSPSSA